MKASWIYTTGLAALLLAGSSFAATQMGYGQGGCMGMGNGGGQYQPEFAELDLNNSGDVTLEEFTAFRQERQANRPGKGRNARMMDDQDMFNVLDQDANGMMSEAEFLEHREGCRGNW
ncbi:EF-hand domain-containing protein [Motilimonas sp. E26]|uniref:EF-hand domain-containing protein n=1 Tax=Motilimonas sp. E26 TaxID=2865674 RepID=UPI001E474421|nr:EF-hand domain-containing protein [Motilimonas sp. E26]MCE0559014.1 EF-hand domain-containing protein [Motilimonas sp. E26]